MWPVIFIFAVLGALVFAAIAGTTVYRLSREEERRQNLRLLWPWLIKGLILPSVLWMVMNIGLSWNLHAFMPQVQAAKFRGTSWLSAFCQVSAAGLFAVSSYWAALTIVCVLFKAATSLTAESRSDYRALCLTSLVAMALPAAILVWIGGWLALGFAVLVLCLPAAGYAPAILRQVKAPPMYSRAIAKMKFGKYSEAEWEIIRQLENAENDFNGWMLLAELYASQFKDLGEAEQIILEVCDQPNVSPPQVSVALHKLADWHLKIASDPDAARRALQVICDRYPRSHLARMAHLRLAQLPRTAEELREQRVALPVPLPALGDNLDDNADEAGLALDSKQAAALANQLSERLTHNPNDVSVRERLARLLAERLGKVDLGIEQIELLLGMADMPDNLRAGWLGLIAAWQLKFKHDTDSARQNMERLIRDFPNSPQAMAANRRLALLAAAQRLQQIRTSRPTIKIVPDVAEPPGS
jgi:TolA-binding protein